MKQEFNLSDYHFDWVQIEHIKEFIRRDTKLIELALNGDITWDKLWKKREKLAGDKLI